MISNLISYICKYTNLNISNYEKIIIINVGVCVPYGIL